MKNQMMACLLMSSVSLGGCAHNASRAMAYDSEATRQVFIWKSNYSAGIGTESGICAQGALTAVANSVKANAEAGAGLKELIVPSLTAGSGEKLGQAALSLGQSVTLTNATNNQTAFANISLFYLCQISLNRSLPAESIERMWAVTNRTISTIGQTSVTPGSISSPTLDDDDGAAAPPPAAAPVPVPLPAVPPVAPAPAGN